MGKRIKNNKVGLEQPDIQKSSICIYCKQELRKKASKCPDCGSYQKNWKNWLVYIPLIVSIVMMAIAAMQLIQANRERIDAKMAKEKAIIALDEAKEANRVIIQAKKQIKELDKFTKKIEVKYKNLQEVLKAQNAYTEMIRFANMAISTKRRRHLEEFFWQSYDIDPSIQYVPGEKQSALEELRCPYIAESDELDRIQRSLLKVSDLDAVQLNEIANLPRSTKPIDLLKSLLRSKDHIKRAKAISLLKNYDENYIDLILAHLKKEQHLDVINICLEEINSWAGANVISLREINRIEKFNKNTIKERKGKIRKGKETNSTPVY